MKKGKMIKLKKGICVLLGALLFSTGYGPAAAAYSNPVKDISDSWDEYGNGDPYVMKFNGTYYLYVSTRDNEKGVKCWSSRDMVNWKYEGNCIAEGNSMDTSKAAYAPELAYYNGKFYMYTSPAGQGHYVFESDNPTGPFEKVTDNFGHSIDGSVFVDDDGKWYFYYASDRGIRVEEMSSPTALTGEEVTLGGTQMNPGGGWTEGSFLIKKGGRYFLTYTGNHVHSKGYRINYSVGTSPKNFQKGMGNPVLLNTEDGIVGLGHSSTVLGPDLSTYYLIYHNLEGRNQWGWPIRNMNMDRIAFNGDKMTVLGPTTTEQDDPALPKICGYFDSADTPGWSAAGGNAGEENPAAVNDGWLDMKENTSFLSEDTLAGNYTAEYNVSSESKTGEIGGYFAYTDENNYGKAGIDLSAGTLKITKKTGGTETISEKNIAKSFNRDYDFSALHTLRIQREKIRKGNDGNTTEEEQYTFYFDNREVGKEVISGIGDGRIGYYTKDCSARMGFIAGSQEYGDSGIFNAYKPVPGVIQAVHFNDGKDGYYDKTPNNHLGLNEGYYRNTPVDIGYTDQQFRIGWNQTGEWYKYNIQVAETGTYDFGLKYVSALDGELAYNLYVDDELVVDREKLTRTKDWASYRTAIRRNIPLTEGHHTIKLETAAGEFDFRELKFVKSEKVEPLYVDYSKPDDGNTYSNGKFRVEDEKLTIDAVGKRLYGSKNWGDYTVEADVTPEDSINCGVILRVNNPSLGGAGDDSQLGTDFYQGYFVGLSSGSIVLGKQNYDWKELQRTNKNIQVGKTYHLRIEAVKDRIRVFVNDEKEPAIDYTDMEDPFMNGKVGFRVHFASTSFDNLMVYEDKADLADQLKKVQIITVDERFEKAAGDAEFSLNAKSNGDGNLSYSVDNDAVLSVDAAGKVTIKGEGTAHIAITASGTDTYKPAEKTVTVIVKEDELTGIKVTAPTKREYVQGEALDQTGLMVTAVYNSKREKDVTAQAKTAGYDQTKTGWQTVTVSFTEKGKTFSGTFDVFVKEKTEPAELNRKALEAAIDRTEGLVKDDYTSSSWGKYQTALTAARQAMESQTVTQDEVDAAAVDLREAIAALDRADKRSLNDAIKRTGERKEADYTRLSWTAMKEKLADAEEVAGNADAKQGEIDDATYQLSEALRNLEEREAVRKVELGVVIDRAESLIETEYTASSWAAMKAALDQAKKITADEAAAQSEVNAASDALRKAINELAKMNKSGLQAAIDRANARNEADYQDKPEQWTAMKAAQAEAEQMMENKDAVQTEIDAVTKKLSEALRQLDPEGTINKEALKAVIARADALTKEDYTETGWAAMEEKLTAANRAVESDLVSQKEVNDAAEALRTALDTLEKYKADKAGLEAAITRADAIKEETYPDKKEEWKAMQDALTLSRGVAQNKDALQTEIDAATRQLNEAIRQLEAVKTVNKNALKAEIDRTVNLNQGDYTASSWTALQEKLTAANKAYESETATQEEVNAAAAALREAIAGLSRADKAGLNDAINRVKDRNEADYTAESWKAMQDVLATVKKVAEDPNATQAQIDEATRQLSEALRQLVKKDVVNKAALEKKYNEVKAVKADGYTAESYAALQTALKNAKAVLDKETATQAEVDAQVKALEDAVKGLKKAGSTAPVVKVSSIKISGISGKIAAGKKIQLSAVISPSNAANKQIKWTTSNKKIATVNSKGLVRIKAKTGGRSVTITAAAADGSGKKATYKIKIMKDAVKKVAISGKKTKSVKAGKKLQLKAKVTAAKKANKKLRWTCSNTKYATVNSKGKVTAKKAGKGKKVKITAVATDGSGKKSTVIIKIK